MKASVVIATRNRREDVRRALDSALIQTVNAEVIVLDDASDDGTAEMIQCEFPAVRLERSAIPQGYIVLRNVGAQLARGEVVFSLDDDAAFSTANVIEQTLRDFSSPRIGAVAIPYDEPNKALHAYQHAPDGDAVWVTDRFIGTAHALRREAFLALGGYRANLIHQGEEMDFCMRLLAAGKVTRLGTSDLIHHYDSPRRDCRRMDFYGRRNDLLFAWYNVPMPYLPFHIAMTTINGLRWAVAAGRYSDAFRGAISGYRDSIHLWNERLPVSIGVYRLNRRLKKHGPFRLVEIESLLESIVDEARLAEVSRKDQSGKLHGTR